MTYKSLEQRTAEAEAKYHEACIEQYRDAAAKIKNERTDVSAGDGQRTVSRAQAQAGKRTSLEVQLTTRIFNMSHELTQRTDGKAMGSNLAGRTGTAWAWLNAVTEYADHHAPARNDDNRFNSSQFGIGDKMKNSALALLAA